MMKLLLLNLCNQVKEVNKYVQPIGRARKLDSSKSGEQWISIIILKAAIE
jgi:hypothetical protein